MRSFVVSAIVAIVLVTGLPTILRGADAPKAAVVHFSKLTPLLVDVAGWEAGKAEGQTVDASGVKMTNVERNYTKGETSVSVRIMDYSEAAFLLQSMTTMWAISSETTQGYQKGVTVNGVNGMEQYENEGKKGSLFLLVAGRYILQVETQGLPAAELQVWAKKVDFKKLAEIK